MCLWLKIIPKNPLVYRRRTVIAKGSGLTLALEDVRDRGWKGTRVLLVGEAGSSCACSMLTDDADCNEPFWKIRPDMLPSIAQIVERTAKFSPEGFSLEAIWAGDKPDHYRVVNLTELKEIILSNRIGTTTRYEVNPAEPVDGSHDGKQ